MAYSNNWLDTVGWHPIVQLEMFRDSCLRNAITLNFIGNNNSKEVKKGKAWQVTGTN